MKVVVMTDAHANLPALEAALEVIQREGYDQLVHLGDVIGIGPYPAETLARLLETPRSRFLMGNHDAWFAYGLPQPQPDWMSDGEVRHQAWTHSRLAAELRQVVAGWPETITESYDGVATTLLHYRPGDTPGSFAAIVSDPSPDDLDRLFEPYAGALILYGHHHPASDLHGRARYVNPGSLGCYRQAVARYAVITFSSGRFSVDHRAVAYADAPLRLAFEQRQVPERELIWQIFFGGR